MHIFGVLKAFTPARNGQAYASKSFAQDKYNIDVLGS